MLKLSERRGSSDGAYCGADGLFLGSSPLVEKIGALYRVRAPEDIAALLEAAYGSGINAARLMPGLRLVAAALERAILPAPASGRCISGSERSTANASNGSPAPMRC